MFVPVPRLHADAAPTPQRPDAELAAELLANPERTIGRAVEAVARHGIEDPRDAIVISEAEWVALDELVDQLADASISAEEWQDQLIKLLGEKRAAVYLASAAKAGQTLTRQLTETDKVQ